MIFYLTRQVLYKKDDNMSLFQDIKNYRPVNQQEERDKEQMLQYMICNTNYLVRENQIAHFTASMWTVNKEHTEKFNAIS